jgi:hypothetical protein
MLHEGESAIIFYITRGSSNLPFPSLLDWAMLNFPMKIKILFVIQHYLLFLN